MVIAGALAMNVDVLLLDEPTAGLDSAGVEALLQTLEEINARGTTLVFSTHEVDNALARVGLADHASHLPAQLSGGERQRVAIARVLASRPQIVFADEPTASLDLASADTVLNWFAQIAAEGATLLMVTHDPQAAARAGSVLVMDSGRIAAHVPGGSAEAVSRAILEIRGRAAA